jgi:hypothetical protein
VFSGRSRGPAASERYGTFNQTCFRTRNAQPAQLRRPFALPRVKQNDHTPIWLKFAEHIFNQLFPGLRLKVRLEVFLCVASLAMLRCGISVCHRIMVGPFSCLIHTSGLTGCR